MAQENGDFSTVSTYTLWQVLHEAGQSWQQSRSWRKTGTALRRRKSGDVIVTDPDTEAKKKLIEHAYRLAESLGIAVGCEDEAGPFQTVPDAVPSWHCEGQPQRQDHEYLRNGTAKVLTLFHPSDGQVWLKGVEQTTNAVLHPWLKAELTAILDTLPDVTASVSQADIQ